VATTNRDFVIKQGIKVATGVTFPDNTVQTTAFTGSVISVGSTFPVSPSNGAMHLDTNFTLSALMGTALDGGSPSTTSFTATIDGGTAA